MTAKLTDLIPRLADSYQELMRNLETAALAAVVKAGRSLKPLIGTVVVKPKQLTVEPVAEIEMRTARLLSEAGPSLVSVAAGDGASLFHTCGFR